MLPDGSLRCITWQMSNKTIKLSHTVPGDNLNWIADAVFTGK